MSRKENATVIGEDKKRIIKTSPTTLSDEQLNMELEKLETTEIEKIYVGEKPAEQDGTIFGKILAQMMTLITDDEELGVFMGRITKKKALLLFIEDKEGEVHGMRAGAEGLAFYNGEEGYDVVVRMYEDTFLDIILGVVDVNWAFAKGYILFEGRNWLLHSEVLRTMFGKFRKAITGKNVFKTMKNMRK